MNTIKTVKIKRVYEPADPADGFRVLVDRLWPRGLTKEAAHLNKWLKAVAPSTELRKWFDHDPVKWKQFCLKYTLELRQNPAVNDVLMLMATHDTVTLLYAAHDEQYNHALVLQQFIHETLKS